MYSTPYSIGGAVVFDAAVYHFSFAAEVRNISHICNDLRSESQNQSKDPCSLICLIKKKERKKEKRERKKGRKKEKKRKDEKERKLFVLKKLMIHTTKIQVIKTNRYSLFVF